MATTVIRACEPPTARCSRPERLLPEVASWRCRPISHTRPPKWRIKPDLCLTLSRSFRCHQRPHATLVWPAWTAQMLRLPSRNHSFIECRLNIPFPDDPHNSSIPFNVEPG